MTGKLRFWWEMKGELELKKITVQMNQPSSISVIRRTHLAKHQADRLMTKPISIILDRFLRAFPLLVFKKS